MDDGKYIEAGTIGEILYVRLPRPRERLALAQDPLYTEYRTSVLEFLYQRQSRPLAKEAA
jgi:nitrate/nitrite transport system ATP-binding protein